MARRRLATGVWAGRVLAVVALVLAQRIRRGSRSAAIALLVGYLAVKGVMTLAGEPWYHGLLVTAAITFGLSQGIWGASALAAVRREAALVPAPPPIGTPQDAAG